MKKIKFIKKLALGLSSTLMLSAVIVQAHSRVSYNLPVYGAKNNYVGSLNSKTTDNMIVLNVITNDHDSFNTITSWVADKNKKAISNDYYLAEGDGALMNHDTVSEVRLAFENSEWRPWSGEVSGQVDYY